MKIKDIEQTPSGGRLVWRKNVIIKLIILMKKDLLAFIDKQPVTQKL